MARKSQLPFDRAMACKFVVVLNPAEQKAVDEFRFQNRIEFKEGAYRELVLRGLQSAGIKVEPARKLGIEDAREQDRDRAAR